MPHRGETEAQAETRRLAFETRRDQQVLDRLYEVERDTPFDTTELYHVPYYRTLEEQNQFLNSIKNTHFGIMLLKIQAQDTRDRVSMILPKFSNTRLEALTTSTIYDYTFPDITKKEEQFLTAMNLGIRENMDGKQATRKNKTQAFKDMVAGTYKYSTEMEWKDYGLLDPLQFGKGRYQEIDTDFQQPVFDPTTGKYQEKAKQQVDPSTSAGYRTNTLKYGYEEPEPQVEKDCPMYCDIVYVPTNTVAYSGLCSCSMLENYKSDPDYRIDQISKRETKPDYRGTQPEPEKLYTVYGQTLPLSQSAVDYYESLGVSVTSAEIDPYVPPTEKPFEKPPRVSVFQPVEPEVTTSQVEPPGVEEPEVITSQVEPSDLIDTIDTIETSQVEPPGVEEPEVITSQVEPPVEEPSVEEVTAQISWFGDTWFPWHLELEDRRRR